MFDPSLPQEGTPLDAVQMRSQLTGLKDLIDAVPTLSGAVVDGVTTLTPAEPASVQTSSWARWGRSPTRASRTASGRT